MALELLPHQREDLPKINELGGRLIIGWDMGLGKTILTLSWLSENRDALPAIIVAPASVKYNWEFEASHYFNMPASICESQSAPKPGFAIPTSPLTIINYDILKYWLPYLKTIGYKTVVFDECQMLQHQWTKRTKASKTLADLAKNVLALSGTPFTNQPSGLWSILNIVRPKEYPSFWSYAQNYCSPRLTPWGWDYSGSSNLDRLHRELIGKCMIRRRKQDVLKDLPDKVRRIVPCEVSDMDEYVQARDNFLVWLKAKMAHKVRSASKAEKLTQIGYLLRTAARLKFRSVVAWANRFLEETDEKLILFAVHRQAIDVLQRRVNAKSVTVDGSVTGRNRQLAVEQFQNDKEVRVFIGNINAAGVGITLTAASEVGICEIPWRPGDLTQAEDRPHRIGQKNTVFINYLIAGGTIEEDLCKLLQKKQEIITSVLDGSPESDFNLYEELIKTLEGRLL